VKGGKPGPAWSVLREVLDDDPNVELPEREDLEFEFKAELDSVSVNVAKPNLKKILKALSRLSVGYYMLAWDDKKPHKMRSSEWGYLPIVKAADGWAIMRRNVLHHVLLSFSTDEELAEAIVRCMRHDG
jgi:hypothetical protein